MGSNIPQLESAGDRFKSAQNVMAQFAFLKEHGCVYGQGFYFSRPLPVDACEQFLLQQQNPKVFASEQQLLP